MAMKDNNKLKKPKEENKRLREKLKTAEEKAQQYKEEMTSRSVIERWKIGKYLHDNLAQQLISARISINLLMDKLSKENLSTSCVDIINVLDESIKEVRNLSHDVIPMDVKEEGVGDAFKLLKLQSERQHGINCRLETGEILNKIKRREVATNLYHIAQEAIKNAVIHGEAKNIKIALIEHRQQLYLHVKDDGKGFNPDDTESGMGITIMKHRAEGMGGSCQIKEADKSSEYNTVVTVGSSFRRLRLNFFFSF